MSTMSPNRSRKRAIFVAGYKGGTGKTTFARILLNRYRRDKMSVVAYDCDDTVGQLLQHYGARGDNSKLLQSQPFDSGVQHFDCRNPKKRLKFIDAIDSDAERILFDLPGGFLTEVAEAIGPDASVRELVDIYKTAGYGITVAIVLSPVLASTRTVQQAIEAFGQNADYVVVLNAAFGEAIDDIDTDFLFYYGFSDGNGEKRGGRGRAALLENNGTEIIMPPIRPRVYAQIDAYNLSFTDAESDTRMLRSSCSHIVAWNRTMNIEMNKAREFLAL